MKWKETKEKVTNWIKEHKVEIIGYTATALVGTGIIVVCAKIASDEPVKPEDVMNIPSEPWKYPEIYDERLNIWIPITRELTEEEFQDMYQLLEDDDEMTVLGVIQTYGLLPAECYA